MILSAGLPALAANLIVLVTCPISVANTAPSPSRSDPEADAVILAVTDQILARLNG